VLKVELLRGSETIVTQHALNDAVISRGELSRLIKLEVSITANRSPSTMPTA
jgi:NAD kinase